MNTHRIVLECQLIDRFNEKKKDAFKGFNLWSWWGGGSVGKHLSYKCDALGSDL